MIVNVRGQGPGAAPAVPRTGGGPQSSARGGAAPLAPSGPQPHAENAEPSSTDAVYDANGDGAIENWGFLHGGDSFTTLTPPPTGSDPTRTRRNTDGPATTAARTATSTAHSTVPAGTPAAKHRAHAAYRRDRAAGAPAPRDSSP